MDFSSNWSQPTDSNHQSQLQENGSIVSGHGLVLSHQLPPFPQNPNPNNHHHVATSSSNIPAARLAGSMAERARQARAPPPEGALKCPRCNSTNTKFCYYNNYNLTQPRHFCKACRRYWTQGGALRNVPVGGGCRRNNKKGKNVNSKTSSSSNKQLSSSTVNAPSQSSGQVIRTNINHQFPFLPSLHNLTQLGGIGLNLAAATTNGNNNNQVPHQIGSSLMNDLGFLRQNTSVSITGNNNNNNNNDNFSVFDPTTELYAYNQNENVGGLSFNNSSSSSMVDSRVYNHTTPVKMEEQTNLVNNLSKPGNHHQPNHQYYWNNSVFSGSSSDDHHHHHQLL